MTLNIQALTMLHMLGAGVYLGLCFDTYSRLRLKKNQWLTLFQDLIFWILNGMIVFLWLQTVNTGEMRVYIFLSLFCGYSMYKALFQGVYLKLLEVVTRFISSCYRLLKWLLRILFINPIIWFYQVILAILLFVFGLLTSLGVYLYRFVCFLIRPFWRGFLYQWQRLFKSKRDPSSPPINEEEERQSNEKNKSFDSEGFLKRLAKWLYNRKE